MSVVSPCLPKPSEVGSTSPMVLPRPIVGVGMAPEIPAGAGLDETVPRTFLVLADLAVLVLAFLNAYLLAPWVRWLLLRNDWLLRLFLPSSVPIPGDSSLGAFPPLMDVVWVLAIMSPAAILFMELLGGYRQLVDQSRTRLLISSVFSPVIALSFITLALFALKILTESRVFILTFGILSVSWILAYRSALRLYKNHRRAAGVYAKNVILVGTSATVRWMRQHFREQVPANRYQLAGWLGVNAEDDEEQVDLSRLGAAEDLGEILVNRPIHEVIAVQSSGERDWLRQVIEYCDYFRVRLRIVPEALLASSPRDLRLIFRSEPLRLPEVVLAPPHLETDALFVKRLIDIVASATLLIVIAPVLLLIAIAIKVTAPHLPVFYPWRVIGLKGRPFTGYKFTTMVPDADERKQELMDRNEMTGPVFKIKNDPRVTPFGKILRKYSLNELPQLWSVLKGDMSLVGPRPAGPHELARYELWHKRKLCVQPGITCLWQVSGRNRINDFDEWVRLDLEYIDKWSLWLDLRILIRTVWTVLGGTGS